MNLGIAFEGCASRCAFHIGVVEYMLEQGLESRISAVSGASSGSIIAACVAAKRAQGLRDVWMEVAGTPVFQPRRILRGRWPMAMSDIVGGVLSRHIGNIRMHDLEIPIAIPVTLLGRRGLKRHVITRRDSHDVVKAVLGSCFFPGPYSRFIALDRQLAFDGAWAVRTPVDDLKPLGTTHIIAVVAHPAGILETGFFRPGHQSPPHNCHVLAALETVPISSWELDTERSIRTIDIGYKSARAFFEDHPELRAVSQKSL